MINNYNDWTEYEGASEGSGRSKKIWLTNKKENEIGLFKYPKTDETKECISECLAYDIANLLKIECAKIEIGEYDNTIGCMSYKINKENEYIIEGIGFINSICPFYDNEKLYDPETKQRYTLQLNLRAISGFYMQQNFLEMCIFDFLIGNTDRHQNNWAMLIKEENETLKGKFSPLYDNGSSLCCYVKENQLDLYLGKDKMKFNSLIDTKSVSMIRLEGQGKTTHRQIIEYIKDNYYDECFLLVECIIENINDINIKKILKKYPEKLLTIKRKMLIEKFLLGKVEILKQIYKK